MPESMTPLVAVGVIGALFVLLLSLLTNNYSLNNIKSKTVGDGQYGTARWATDQEIRKAYVTVPFDVASWRAGKKRPTVQGLVLGSVQRGKRLEALVDRDDVHCLMIGASGVGKTAFFLYPNIEFACACGMSFLILDTKGDLARNCGKIAQKYYGCLLYTSRDSACQRGVSLKRRTTAKRSAARRSMHWQSAAWRTPARSADCLSWTSMRGRFLHSTSWTAGRSTR